MLRQLFRLTFPRERRNKTKKTFTTKSFSHNNGRDWDKSAKRKSCFAAKICCDEKEVVRRANCVYGHEFLSRVVSGMRNFAAQEHQSSLSQKMFSRQFSDRAKFFSSCTSCGKANAVDSIMKTCWQFIAPWSWMQPLVDGDNETIKAYELSTSSQVPSNTRTSYKNLLFAQINPQRYAIVKFSAFMN